MKSIRALLLLILNNLSSVSLSEAVVCYDGRVTVIESSRCFEETLGTDDTRRVCLSIEVKSQSANVNYTIYIVRPNTNEGCDALKVSHNCHSNSGKCPINCCQTDRCNYPSLDVPQCSKTTPRYDVASENSYSTAATSDLVEMTQSLTTLTTATTAPETTLSHQSTTNVNGPSTAGSLVTDSAVTIGTETTTEFSTTRSAGDIPTRLSSTSAGTHSAGTSTNSETESTALYFEKDASTLLDEVANTEYVEAAIMTTIKSTTSQMQSENKGKGIQNACDESADFTRLQKQQRTKNLFKQFGILFALTILWHTAASLPERPKQDIPSIMKGVSENQAERRRDRKIWRKPNV